MSERRSNRIPQSNTNLGLNHIVSSQPHSKIYDTNAKNSFAGRNTQTNKNQRNFEDPNAQKRQSNHVETFANPNDALLNNARYYSGFDDNPVPVSYNTSLFNRHAPQTSSRRGALKSLVSIQRPVVQSNVSAKVSIQSDTSDVLVSSKKEEVEKTDNAELKEEVKKTDNAELKGKAENAELKEFYRKLYDAFSKGLHGIFTFQVGDQSVEVFEAVFAAQSSVFKRLMLSDADEAKTKICKLDEFSIGAVRQFANYIHLHEIDELNLFNEQILELAQKYEMKDLENICLKHDLSGPLSDKNIAHRLVEAYTKQHAPSMFEAVEYITRASNKTITFKQIMATEKWREFEKVHTQFAFDATNAILGDKANDIMG